MLPIFLLVLFPVLLMFNTPLAFVALAVAIVLLYMSRTTNGTRPVPFAAPVKGLYTTVEARLKSPFLNSIGGMIERWTRPALSIAR